MTDEVERVDGDASVKIGAFFKHNLDLFGLFYLARELLLYCCGECVVVSALLWLLW